MFFGFVTDGSLDKAIRFLFLRKLRKNPLRLDGGSFPPVMQDEKLEIHKVFLNFPSFCLTKNLSPPALVDFSGASVAETGNPRSATQAGSFAPKVQYEKQEIHPVFPCFPYFPLEQNLSPWLLARGFPASCQPKTEALIMLAPPERWVFPELPKRETEKGKRKGEKL